MGTGSRAGKAFAPFRTKGGQCGWSLSVGVRNGLSQWEM